MAASFELMNRFDKTGLFRDGDGAVDVVFRTKDAKRYPGTIEFANGLCVRARMDRGGDWSYPDNSPLDEVRFLLDFDDERPREIRIDQGRVVHRDSTRQEFLNNLRLGWGLFSNPGIVADGADLAADEVARSRARAAVWLTPKSVADFSAADFPELGEARQRDLQAGVRDFLRVANAVPADRPPTPEQYRSASESFGRVAAILTPNLSLQEEAQRVRDAFRGLAYPPWVVNWDYKLETDYEGTPIVQVTLFIDDVGAAGEKPGRFATDVSLESQQALNAAKVERRSRVKVRTVTGFKTQS